MQKWEYRYVSMEIQFSPVEELYGEHQLLRHINVNNILNKLGSEGWMLIQYSLNPSIFVFKRPLA
jgi:hypothetical protein